MKKNAVFGFIFSLIGFLIILTPKYILPVCEYTRESHALSSCSYMGKAEMLFGFVMVGIALGSFFSKTNEALKWLMPPALFTAISVIALPTVTGYCASPHMPCNFGTVPLLRLIGGVAGILAIVGFVLAREKK